MGEEEECLCRALDGEVDVESTGTELSLHTQNDCTYIFLSVEHEAAIELGELAEGHVSIPQLGVL